MGICQVHHMNVISYACAILCRIISAKYLYLFIEALGRIDYKRDEMGLGMMEFPDFPIRVSPRGIEVPQIDMLETVCPIIILQGLFNDEFGSTVGIDRLLRMVLRDGDLFRKTIGRAGGGGEEMLPP